MTVNTIDWCAATNAIITGSQDRSAFVWHFNSTADSWDAQAVVLRFDRAVTALKWSPDGQKFAAGASDRKLVIGSFEPTENWWIVQGYKKVAKSTITCIDWHPSGKGILASGSDYKARICSALLPSVDGPDAAWEFAGQVNTGMSLVLEFDQPLAWVHACAWAPSGNKLMFTSHESVTYIAAWSEGGWQLLPILSKHLPATCGVWLSEHCFITAGHDDAPIVFGDASGEWTELGQLDAAAMGAGSSAGSSSIAAKRALFAAKTSSTSPTAASTKPKQIHSGAIVEVRHLGGSKFSSIGMDGRIAIWDMKTASPSFSLDGLGL